MYGKATTELPRREVEGDVTASHRQLVLAMVPARRLRWRLQSLRASYLHHQYREEDLDRWRVSSDVQMLALHTNLRTTQGYIEANADAQVRIVDRV
jgi:hypothetical protein